MQERESNKLHRQEEMRRLNDAKKEIMLQRQYVGCRCPGGHVSHRALENRRKHLLETMQDVNDGDQPTNDSGKIKSRALNLPRDGVAKSIEEVVSLFGQLLN